MADKTRNLHIINYFYDSAKLWLWSYFEVKLLLSTLGISFKNTKKQV